jgi:hypothetical protein
MACQKQEDMTPERITELRRFGFVRSVPEFQKLCDLARLGFVARKLASAGYHSQNVLASGVRRTGEEILAAYDEMNNALEAYHQVAVEKSWKEAMERRHLGRRCGAAE